MESVWGKIPRLPAESEAHVAFNVKTNSIPSQTTEPKELSISISVLHYYSAALVK